MIMRCIYPISGFVLLAMLAGSASAQFRTQLDAARTAGLIGNPQLAQLAPQNEPVTKQQSAKAAPEVSRDDEKFWWKPERQKAAAAAEMVLEKNAFTLIAMRLHGIQKIVWGEQEYSASTAPHLTSKWLGDVDDGVFPDFRAGKWRFVPFWELPDEYKVYCEALVKANDTPLEAFKESARENADVTFAHMYREPWKYRGSVIEINGRIRRVRRYDAPRLAREDGVKDVYEGWIFGDTPGAHPVCVLFTALPGKLPVAEDVDARVTFRGYFFKRYKYVTGEQYTAKDGSKHNRQRDTLLLIGPTVELKSPVTAAGGNLNVSFVRPETLQLAVVVLVVGVIVAASVVILGIFYRRSDERVRKNVAQIRTTKMDPFENENQDAGLAVYRQSQPGEEFLGEAEDRPSNKGKV